MKDFAYWHTASNFDGIDFSKWAIVRLSPRKWALLHRTAWHATNGPTEFEIHSTYTYLDDAVTAARQIITETKETES